MIGTMKIFILFLCLFMLCEAYFVHHSMVKRRTLLANNNFQLSQRETSADDFNSQDDTRYAGILANTTRFEARAVLLERVVLDMKSRLTEKDALITTLETTVEELNNTLTASKSAEEALLSEVKQLQSNYASSEKTKKAAMERKLSEVREASLRQQLESRGEIEALQNKATLASAEAEKYLGRTLLLENALFKLKAQLESLRVDSSTAAEEKSSLQLQVQSQSGTIISLQSQLAEERKLSKLQIQKQSQLESQLQEKQQQIKVLLDTEKRLRQQVKTAAASAPAAAKAAAATTTVPAKSAKVPKAVPAPAAASKSADSGGLMQKQPSSVWEDFWKAAVGAPGNSAGTTSGSTNGDPVKSWSQTLFGLGDDDDDDEEEGDEEDDEDDDVAELTERPRTENKKITTEKRSGNKDGEGNVSTSGINKEEVSWVMETAGDTVIASPSSSSSSLQTATVIEGKIIDTAAAVVKILNPSEVGSPVTADIPATATAAVNSIAISATSASTSTSASASAGLLQVENLLRKELLDAKDLMELMETEYLSEIKQLKEFIDTMRKDERITQIQQESLLENAKNEATEIQSQLSEKEQQRAELQSQLDASLAQVQDLTLKLTSLQRQLEQAQKELDARREDVQTQPIQTQLSQLQQPPQKEQQEAFLLQVASLISTAADQRAASIDYLLTTDLKDQRRVLERQTELLESLVSKVSTAIESQQQSVKQTEKPIYSDIGSSNAATAANEAIGGGDKAAERIVEEELNQKGPDVSAVLNILNEGRKKIASKLPYIGGLRPQKQEDDVLDDADSDWSNRDDDGDKGSSSATVTGLSSSPEGKDKDDDSGDDDIGGTGAKFAAAPQSSRNDNAAESVPHSTSSAIEAKEAEAEAEGESELEVARIRKQRRIETARKLGTMTRKVGEVLAFWVGLGFRNNDENNSDNDNGVKSADKEGDRSFMNVEDDYFESDIDERGVLNQRRRAEVDRLSRSDYEDDDTDIDDDVSDADNFDGDDDDDDDEEDSNSDSRRSISSDIQNDIKAGGKAARRKRGSGNSGNRVSVGAGRTASIGRRVNGILLSGPAELVTPTALPPASTASRRIEISTLSTVSSYFSSSPTKIELFVEPIVSSIETSSNNRSSSS